MALKKDTFRTPQQLQKQYQNQLRAISRKVQSIVQRLWDESEPEKSMKAIQAALRAYAQQLGPWAQQQAWRYISRVNDANIRAWRSISERLGREMQQGYFSGSPIYKLAQDLQNEQVDLIVTVPQRMAERVQDLSRQYLAGGLRHTELAQRIESSAQVADYVAQRLARTEISKANSALLRARCEEAGCTHFIWRTAGDGIVRDSHRHLNGKVFRFDKPPLIPKEGRHLPGEFPNCRCWAEPVLESEL